MTPRTVAPQGTPRSTRRTLHPTHVAPPWKQKRPRTAHLRINKSNSHAFLCTGDHLSLAEPFKKWQLEEPLCLGTIYGHPQCTCAAKTPAPRTADQQRLILGSDKEDFPPGTGAHTLDRDLPRRSPRNKLRFIRTEKPAGASSQEPAAVKVTVEGGPDPRAPGTAHLPINRSC